MITNIISFSGGKDSTALILWAKENLSEFETVFCDTGWEHEITYKYINYINETLLNGKLITIKSEKYDGFYDLSVKKKRVASAKARFCTEQLKLVPMQKFIKSLDYKVDLYLGIRADESASRAKLTPNVFDADFYKCMIFRPLLYWTAKECFDLMQKHNIEPNQLYKMGMKRVGCMPCIMSNHKELKQILIRFPEVYDKMEKLENEIGRTFFAPKYIPERFMTKRDEKTGKPCPTINDVKNYLVKTDLSIFEEPEGESCMSYYSICE